jgi:hypothetical protein
MKKFEIPKASVSRLENGLKMFHHLFKDNKCAATLIEELFVKSLRMDPKLKDLTWKCGSHAQKADMTLPSGLTISVKSATIDKDILTMSGHRLTTNNGDFNKINASLKNNIADVMVCFLHDEKEGTYQVFYIDEDVFQYPNSARAWKPINKKVNLSHYIAAKDSTKGIAAAKLKFIEDINGLRFGWNASNGMSATVTPKMSWQIWWHIPTNLCRVGPTLRSNIRKR